MSEVLSHNFKSLAYLIASLFFILTLQGLSSPKGARRGLLLGEIGMLLAVVGTLVAKEIVSYNWILAGLCLGTIIGIPMGLWIPMTKMPERIALSHSFGGLATAMVGVSEFYRHTTGVTHEELGRVTMGTLAFETFLGFLTFTGSLMAFSKLQGLIRGAPITYPGQNKSNIAMFFVAFAIIAALVVVPGRAELFYALPVLGLLLGVLFVLPIGGADMPVVISLLNSYAGLAASATGFAIGSNILIIAGALDGSSGLLLSILMSKAMNRSFSNVLFGAFGTDIASDAQAAAAPGAAAHINVASIDEAADVLRAAQSMIIVPGYGMAVSQAQHACRDLASVMEARGATVKYAIHPVAGRMPGHMNVLLAEADVPYTQLFDLDDINDDFQRTDVVLVVGANDVVNPAAKTNPKSPIYGMPVFNVEQARSVMVLKRSLAAGFSGVDNDLFTQPKTMMVLGDAKKTLLSLVGALKHD